MHRGIAVNFAGGRLEDLGANPLRQPQHVDCADNAGFGRLHRVVLIMYGGGGAGQVEYLVHLDIERKGNVVPQRLEMRISQQVSYVVLAPGKVVVHAKHVVAVAQQALTQMRT